MIDSKLFQAIKASDLLGCQWQKDASSPLSIISTVREPPLRTHSPSRAHIHTPAFNLKLQERLLSLSPLQSSIVLIIIISHIRSTHSLSGSRRISCAALSLSLSP